jgi:hypothetical protein
MSSHAFTNDNITKITQGNNFLSPNHQDKEKHTLQQKPIEKELQEISTSLEDLNMNKVKHTYKESHKDDKIVEKSDYNDYLSFIDMCFPPGRIYCDESDRERCEYLDSLDNSELSDLFNKNTRKN